MGQTYVFISWNEQKAYILLSLLRNAGVPVPVARIPGYVEHKDGSRTPYKSVIEAECDGATWEGCMGEMYERYDRIPEEKRT